MKYIFLLSYLFFITLNATVYTGQGNGSTQSEAKQNALKDISEQISVSIDTETKQDKKLIDGKYSKDIVISTSQSSNTNIVGYELISMNFKDGIYTTKLQYENIPSLDKFAKKVPYSKKDILKSIKKDFGYSLGMELIRKDKKWYIKYKDDMQILDNKDFARFFKTTPNENLIINTNKRNNILYEDDEFYFELTSSKKGYISILTVYEDGTVSVMMKNIKVEANTKENLPDKDFEAIPQAGLLEKGKDTFDMYVAVLSPKKLILDQFAVADGEQVEDERYKNFDQLIEFLNDKKYITLKVVTKHR